MYRWRPSQWVKWSFLAGLPFLASAVISSPELHKDVAERANAEVKKAGEWASVDFNGRDATIRGDAPSKEAVDAATKAVAGTYGVRTFTSLARVVEQKPLAAPMAQDLATTNKMPELKGTWPQNEAASLSVTVAGKTYNLNTDPEIVSANGAWTLRTSSEIADGSYDIDVEAKNAAGLSVKAIKPGKLTIDTTAPIAVTFQKPAANAPALPFQGTWAEGDAKSLTVVFENNSYVLAKDKELTSDGKGLFSFMPPTELKPGKYPVEVIQADSLGNKQTSQTEIVITAMTPAPEPAPTPEPMPLAPPTVQKISDGATAPVITGTWPEAAAKGLIVKVGETAYELGKNPELTSDGAGNWTLKPTARLPDGETVVTAEIKDAAGNVLAGKAPAVAAIDSVAPANPTVATAPLNAKWPYPLTGQFPEADTKAFSVKLLDRTYVLGKDPELTSDGNGGYSFSPKIDLGPGSYDLDFALQDAAGNANNYKSAAAIVIPEPPKPVAAPAVDKPQFAAPTVEKQLDLSGKPEIKGTWPQEATTLSVTAGSKTYNLGADSNLKNEGNGKWTLAITEQLADGVYDVVTRAGDDNGQSVADATVGELEVAAVQPTAPTVAPYNGDATSAVVSGTWDDAKATTLKVSIPGIGLTAVSGKDATLKTDGNQWTLTLPQQLAPGTYDVAVETSDKHSRTQTDTTSGELVLEPPKQPEPAPAPEPEAAPEPAPAPEVAAPAPAPAVVEPYDCAKVLQSISTVFPIRFEYDRTRLIGTNELAITQYAAVLKDPRCASLRVEISGHADSRGPTEYNQFLSELRAARVLRALKESGIDPSRLKVVGFNEALPVDPEKTEEAWAKNRRVEFKPF
jgi:outer membrane protein OmpA-like peptidoglycan-associated protein